MRKLDERTRVILSGAAVAGVVATVAEQVERHEWEAVADVFTALGGVYDRRSKGYRFETDPTAAIRDAVDAGVVESVRLAEGYVPTPEGFAESLTAPPFSNIDDLPAGARVLEPSAGGGQLVRAILDANPAVRVVAVEPNRARSRLIGSHDAVTVVNETFERFAADRAGEVFDAVVMNPPFSVPPNATIWMDHVRLAWDLLRPGGRLVAVVPAGFTFRGGPAWERMRRFVEEHGGYDKAPRGTFSMSAVVLRLTKPVPCADGRPRYVFRPYDDVEPVRVAVPRLTGEAVVSAPVQVWRDAWRSGDRVLRFRAQCAVCAWLLWEFDDGENDPRGVLGDSSAGFSADPAHHGEHGPVVGLCPLHGSTGEEYERALTLARRELAAEGSREPVSVPSDLWASFVELATV